MTAGSARPYRKAYTVAERRCCAWFIITSSLRASHIPVLLPGTPCGHAWLTTTSSLRDFAIREVLDISRKIARIAGVQHKNRSLLPQAPVFEVVCVCFYSGNSTVIPASLWLGLPGFSRPYHPWLITEPEGMVMPSSTFLYAARPWSVSRSPGAI